MTKRIVLTGGPGAGKTRISQALAVRHPDRLVAVPEAASTIYAQRGTRWDHLDVAQRCDIQRQIYHLQRQHEQLYEQLHPGKVLILDRGTIDGSAYWPLGPDDYWRDLGTSLADELKRYHAVIVLQTCAAIGLYDGDATNPCRYEDADAALARDDTLRRIWSAHPTLYAVGASADLDEKIRAVQSLVERVVSE